MSRKLSTLAPLVSITLAASFLAGCGMTPDRPTLPVTAAQSKTVKMQAAARKETRAQAERRAKGYIAEFNDTNYRSIRSRTEMVQKIARTDADAAYEFLLGEVETLHELRGEMKKLTREEYEEYEETLMAEVDEMTPDQNTVKQRVAKAKALNLDLEEVSVMEEMQESAGGVIAQGGGARVGSRNRLLTAIQENRVVKAVSKAVKNTRKKVKKFLSNLWKKLRFKR